MGNLLLSQNCLGKNGPSHKQAAVSQTMVCETLFETPDACELLCKTPPDACETLSKMQPPVALGLQLASVG